eukprot:Rhum_TRINITY_DN13283_c0_g1::Rhum_TRINITY_DN13283_c0_g1_i4::g.58708::m.58708/K15731/CTDSP; carboxy-terminal domain RNA polymerase II polypeptide A small phosphatase
MCSLLNQTPGGRVPLGTLDRNMPFAESRKRNAAALLACEAATAASTTPTHDAHRAAFLHSPASVYSGGNSEGSSATPSREYDSPLEVTPVPSSPSSDHCPSPFRVPSLTPTPHLCNTSHLLLPPQAAEHRGKMTVVFDLDETLVSNRRPGASPAIQRHYLKHMCRLLEGLVEVVLWTASTEETGRPVVEQIDPKGTFFHHVVFRSAKWFSSATHTKDLTLLGRDMERVIIIENTPNCCKLNPQNALMVEDFRGDLSQPDRTLLNVATILRGAVESGKKGISVTRFLKFYSRVADTVIDMYELGIPEGYMGLTKEEAVKRAMALPEIQRPPLGIYYYSKKH